MRRKSGYFDVINEKGGIKINGELPCVCARRLSRSSVVFLPAGRLYVLDGRTRFGIFFFFRESRAGVGVHGYLASSSMFYFRIFELA